MDRRRRRKTHRASPRKAHYTNFASSPDDFRRKSEVLKEHCADVGTDFDAITRSANYNVILGEEPTRT